MILLLLKIVVLLLVAGWLNDKLNTKKK